jgi:hypothetical protein
MSLVHSAQLVGDQRHLDRTLSADPCRHSGHQSKGLEPVERQAALRSCTSQTQHHLGQENTPAPHGIIAERQAEAMRLLRFFALSATVHERLWKQLDMVYFLRHSAEEIAWHTRSLHYRIFNDQPVVRARLHQEGEGLQVMVYTKDQPDLLPASSDFLRVPATALLMPKFTPRRTATRWTVSFCLMFRIATMTGRCFPTLSTNWNIA